MQTISLEKTLQQAQLKTKLPQIKPGDTVRVHQLIREGNKTRTQVFEGLVIRYRKPNEGNASLTVRKIASSVGVEKTWFVHSPNVEKIEVIRRSKVRRAFLSYMRERQGKSARLTEQEFDKAAANEADSRTAGAVAAEAAVASGADDDAAAPVESEEGVVESTEDLAREEDRQAAADASNDEADDEATLPAEETQAGLDRADAEDAAKA